MIRDEPRDPSGPDTRGRPREVPGGDCANHPGRPAAAACADCGRGLCPDCFYASGGGHAFCRECMERTRLVDAEPKILGAPAAEPAAGSGPGTAWTAALVVMALVALLAAAFLICGLVRAAGS